MKYKPLKYTVKKIIDKVYLLSFKCRYDMCMFFLRYQEFYESPNPKFRGKAFYLVDFMEWYSKNHGPNKRCPYFSYPVEWGGFNISSGIIDEVNALGIPDDNKYDYEMIKLHRKLQKKAGGAYYLIGAAVDPEDNKVDENTVEHELAHGLYYINSAYKKEMNQLVKKIPPEMYQKFCEWLKSIGYTKKVFKDETQAYLATGHSWNHKRPWIKLSKEFADVFNKFREEAMEK